MRKLPLGNRVESFPSIVLYRDDVEELLGMLGNTSERVTISDNECEFDSLDEVAQVRGPNLKTLTMTSSNPFVELSLNGRGDDRRIVLRGESSDNATAIFHRIGEKLKSRRRFLTRVFILRAWVPVTILAFFAFAKPENTTSDPLSVVIILALIAGDVLALFLQTGMLSKISLARRHESKSWLKEHVEPLLWVFVGAIFGSLGTATATLITKLVGDHSGK